MPCDASVIRDIDADSPLLENRKNVKGNSRRLHLRYACTRPDSCYVVGNLSNNLYIPTKADLNLSKNLLKYIKDTFSYSLNFRMSDYELKLVGCLRFHFCKCKGP